VRDRSGKFRIHITELDWQRFHEFLPIGFGYQPLCALVRFTLRPARLRHSPGAAPEEIRELRIGEKTLSPGMDQLALRKADGVVTLGSKIH
jgi:type VI secretion system protein ImpH